MSGAYVN